MTPADEFSAFERQETPVAVAPPPPSTTEFRQPILSFRRIVPPVDTIALGDELHVIKPLMVLSLEVQTAVINDRNAQLNLQRRVENHEILDEDEKKLLPFYLERIIRTAIPTVPDWVFNAPDAETDAGLLPEQHESICTFFFARSQELRDLLGATVVRPISRNSSPDSSVSTAATPVAGSASPDSGSMLTRANSRRSKRANNSSA